MLGVFFTKFTRITAVLRYVALRISSATRTIMYIRTETVGGLSMNQSLTKNNRALLSIITNGEFVKSQ